LKLFAPENLARFTRPQAALFHLGLSALIAAAIVAVMLLAWYPSPYFAAAGGATLLLLLIGVDVVLGHPFYVSGSPNVERFLNEETRELFGASFHVEEDPKKAAATIIALLDQKREKLGINKKSERKLLDMKDRRAHGV